MNDLSGRFRILSLDGGGIRGTYSASVLATLEEMTGQRIVDHFDLITGTSTGGIIALGLGMGLSAGEILHFYVSDGPRIFPSTGVFSRWGKRIRHAFRNKHPAEPLRAALEQVFGDCKLGEARCRLVITSYDAIRGDVNLFKTAHSPRFRQDDKRPVVEVALATAAAPTYLPMFKGSDGLRLIDGGVWANCPATVGLLEAIAVLGKRPDEIDILSIGTTSEPFSVPEGKTFGGLTAWAWDRTVLRLLMQAQEKAALAQANLITRHRMLRIDHTVVPGRFTLDNSGAIEEMKALGAQDARHHAPKVVEGFLCSPVEPFEPCHQL
jgi:uncharacterized protein